MFARALIVALVAASAAADCTVNDDDKVDCKIGDQSSCEAAGCCWAEHTSDDQGKVPWCFVGGASASSGYALSGASLTASGLTGTLTALAPGTDSLGADIVALSLAITFDTSDHLRVLITDKTDPTRWQIPTSIVPSTVAASSPASPSPSSSTSADLGYDLTYTESPFTFTVTRTSDGAVVFASSPNLVFKDQYLELGTSLDPTAGLFGIGESTRTSGLKVRVWRRVVLCRNVQINDHPAFCSFPPARTATLFWSAWALDHPHLSYFSPQVPLGSTSTLWARDTAAAAFDTNLYGSHPVYLALATSGAASGAFLRNSNGMDVVYAEGGDSLTFKVIGGVLDLFVFVGPSPAQVAAQYTALVGRPAMMPYWSLGYHQCRCVFFLKRDTRDVSTAHTHTRAHTHTHTTPHTQTNRAKRECSRRLQKPRYVGVRRMRTYFRSKLT